MNGKRTFLALLCCALTGIAAPAHAARQTMYYDVYAGGIHALEAKLDINMGAPGGRYDIILSAETYGFLGKLVPWKGTFESHGWVMKDGSLRPEQHRSEAYMGKEYNRKIYKYSREGKFLSFDEVEMKNGKETLGSQKRKKKAKLDLLVAQDTTDALSATLEILSKIGAGKKCEGAAEVFDGKRRFKEIFMDKGFTDMKASDYNVYSGEAAVCEVKVEPLAGEWSKNPRGWMSIQEQGVQHGGLPTMWAGKIQDQGPALPMKILIKTGYGALMMHMSEYQGGDKKLISEKRANR